MSYIKVWLHFVWSTKDRKPHLTDDIRQKVFQHIRENAREKGIFIDFINGYVEHAHCLISLLFGSDNRKNNAVDKRRKDLHNIGLQ